jgi:predicted nucleic acid-binding Zn ribbon protein
MSVADRRRDDEPVPLAASVDEVVRSLRGPSAKAVAGVFAGWDDLVGPTVAAHARPVSLTSGRLVIEVDEPGWATQLRYLESTLRERLAAAIGGAEVTAIEVRVRPR